jgi:hypothetical protein
MRLVTSLNMNLNKGAETQQQMKAAQQLPHGSTLEKLAAIGFLAQLSGYSKAVAVSEYLSWNS